MRRLSVLLSLGLFFATAINGQTATDLLQPGKVIEKTLAAGQTHSYAIDLEKDQFVQLAVEQRDIDVVIRVFAPGGNLVHEFDSPTGTEGKEYAEVISESAGRFRIEVAAINDGDVSASGKYELKILEWRKATDQELQFRKNESTRKAKGLALVVETSQSFDQFRLPETRVTMRIKAAQLLWPSDEKRASTLMSQAIETVKQLIAENSYGEDDQPDYQSMLNLRQQVLSALAPHDPEAALKFLQSTRLSSSQSDDQEVQLESSLINQVAAKDPKKAFELAEDLLHRTSSYLLIQTLNQLAPKDRDLACRLARDIAKKLESEDLLKNPQSTYLISSLLQVVRNPLPSVKQDGENSKPARLLSDEEFRDLFLKLISELMAQRSSGESVYAPEYAVTRSLAGTIGQMQEEIKTYAPDRLDAINKRISELGGQPSPPAMEWQRYQTVMNQPIDTALESVEQAPLPIRDYLYQQVVSRIAATGDLSRARQLVSERITNPSQRKQVLYTLQQQAITAAAQKGRLDEALQLVSKFPRSERIALLNQVIDEIGPGVKRPEALQYLDRAKNLISTSVRAEDSEQMQTLLAIARAYARHDLNRAFQIVEPLIDQFNEICAAAVTMNGFGGEYYVEGEMTTARNNAISDLADDISNTLATLAMFDFDRAKRDADGLSRFDARVRTLLAIAGHALEIHLDSDESDVEPN